MTNTTRFAVRVYTNTPGNIKIVSGCLDLDILKTRTAGLAYLVIGDDGSLGIFNNGAEAAVFTATDNPDIGITYSPEFSAIFIQELMNSVMNAVDNRVSVTETITLPFPVLESFYLGQVFYDYTDPETDNYSLIANWLFQEGINLQDAHLYHLSDIEIEEHRENMESYGPMRGYSIKELVRHYFAVCYPFVATSTPLELSTNEFFSSQIVELFSLIDLEEMKC